MRRLASVLAVLCLWLPVGAAGQEITLHEFAGVDGGNPKAGLTVSGSTLFGTTVAGGASDKGTVFSIGTDGSNYQTLHEFAGGPGDGGEPYARLTLVGSTLFGTTRSGGASDSGTIFSMDTDGSNYQLLHEFAGGADDGKNPLADLTLSGSTLFGTTYRGGDKNKGTVFSINVDGSGFQLLHEFTVTNGANPRAGLALGGSTLFGTTEGGGSSYVGTIFSIDTDGSNFQLLHEFTADPNAPRNPNGRLIRFGATLFGTTYVGGAGDLGTVFSIRTDGSNFRLLHEFAGWPSDGEFPEARLTRIGSTLFGTAKSGGISGWGAIFSLNTDGSNYQLLHEFAGQPIDGGFPDAGLTLSGSTLFGTALYGGANDQGTVFSIPVCALDVALTYEGSTLTMDFLLGSQVPGTWSVWMYSGAFPSWTPLWSVPLPALPTTPISIPIPNVPDLGVVAVLTSFEGPGGVVCWSFDFVNTSPPE